uniref:LITAF domain-containing protein n=1 Tax=Amphiprion ocellaris TaxID=80972 RepID=A0AAQ5XHA2_AMPOC
MVGYCPICGKPVYFGKSLIFYSICLSSPICVTFSVCSSVFLSVFFLRVNSYFFFVSFSHTFCHYHGT